MSLIAISLFQINSSSEYPLSQRSETLTTFLRQLRRVRLSTSESIFPQVNYQFSDIFIRFCTLRRRQIVNCCWLLYNSRLSASASSHQILLQFWFNEISIVFLIFHPQKSSLTEAMATFDLELPNDEELTVPEVNISSPALRAGAFHLGKKCESQNNVSSNFAAMNINFWLHHQTSNSLFFFAMRYQNKTWIKSFVILL